MNINKYSGHAELEINELRALIQGKFDFRKCLDCNGNGRVLVDGELGMVVQSMPSGRDPSDFFMDQCDECCGLGGYLRFND